MNAAKYSGIIFDLDGTVYHGERAIPGADALVRELRRRGVAIRFVTNRANRPPEEVSRQLNAMGLDCKPADVLTSAGATAAFLKPGKAYVIGEHGMLAALEQRGFVIDDQAPDYVIVSFDRGFDFDKLRLAVRLISRGARFVASNPDHALALEDGLSPGTGALVAAVQTATGVTPLMIGKPQRHLFDIVLRDMCLTGQDVIAVGDNLATDIPAGHAAGMRTVLICTGISRRADLEHAAVQPTWTVDDYDGMRALLLD